MKSNSFDTILENGTIYDGTGGEGYVADVGILNGEITSIGQLNEASGANRIDIAGMALSPGFIDLHTHSDFTLIADGKAESQVHQGVTTEVVGQCGHSVAPLRHRDELARQAKGFGIDTEADGWQSFGEYLEALEKKPLGVNVAAFVGHGAIHHAVMGDDLRFPEPEEVDQMTELLRQSLEEGAAGFSTGLEYWPGSMSSPETIEPLCRVTAEYDRLYATHVRNRDRFYDLGFGEAISTARAAECRLQISHIQPKYGAPDYAMNHTLEMIRLDQKYGLDVAFDIIPHDWSHTLVMAILPKWAQEGGVQKIIERLQDTKTRERIKQNRNPMWLLVADRIWSKIVLLSSQENPQLIGETLEDIGKMRGVDPYDAVFDLLLEEGRSMQRLFWTSNSFRHEDLVLCLEQSDCAVISDTKAVAPVGLLENEIGSLSGYGWTSEFLSKYVKEKKTLSLAEGIRRMTSLPAERLGVKNRGLIKTGFKADITVFDPNAVASTWTIKKPRSFAKGFEHVFVNGVQTIHRGKRTQDNCGEVLRGNG
ncbi:MAG: N-acyl-D-aspartate/D-glutamate deacylase [bacterium]|jgi:N-acyl-D-aspartate/D-glutamate deacylase